MSDRPSEGWELEELREEFDWMYEFNSRMAERITDDPDVHSLAAYVEKIERTNAELHKELEQWHKLTENIELPEYPLTEFQPKDLERENAKLREKVKRQAFELDSLRRALTVRNSEVRPWKSQAERLVRINAKLRELVADMWFWHYEGHIDSESQERQMLHIDAVIQRMRELGVEVEG